MDLPMDGALPDMPPSKAPAPVPPGRCPRRPLRARVPPPRISIALPRPPQRPSPPPRQLAPLPPPSASPGPGKGAATRHRGPVAPGPGDQRPPAARGRVGAGASGLPTRGSPCQGPHSKIPRRPNMPHPTQRSHDGELQSPRPGPFGQVRFYTNPPTPFGVGCVVPGLPPVRSPGARAPGQTAAQRTGEYPKSHYSAARRRGLAHDDPQGVVLVQSAPHSPPGGHNSQEVAPLGPPAQPVQQTGEYPESHIQPPMEGAFPQ
ncbi:hypothetical protein N7472_011009 [Penicillium cf. griseofulvum]|uniref:Uncharacterized protein n=2 Tax=Penicillium cf. griseofulvum TaxID=2972120 RepID=A0A9W9IY28_9EURO|nr:hypothetical protein N7472_010979 [Penicillium cf. griseofulvum]KAJ5186145.1 hypothetical protein N7472_010985 [Penicillium cf. griseofulvum]KAJ5186169.1 hypothetical protein N7472_011009 [Penicillium cf. griseofulvum]